ncbi:GNAT family N-acetyltransferase [Winogradskya humida]|uniref:N-acetyltransferase n=1 Tax=Winogradskya humida TaxID=113566 RepID=A0ABQ4A3Z1_9ACTN|nr:GNAT family N-acetyltransferase [Actinoplanes humidus]GIE25562.1 N-acetyltransferase [Actinoplanes humidus]
MVDVRRMVLEDVAEVSRLRVAGWQAAYRGIIPDSYLDAMDAEADARQRATWRSKGIDLVAHDEKERLTGWCCSGPAGAAGHTEIFTLYVRPELIGSGIGAALLAATHRHWTALGVEGFQLWVLRGNKAARRFYERFGYAPDGTAEAYEYDGVAVEEVRYRRSAG